MCTSPTRRRTRVLTFQPREAQLKRARRHTPRVAPEGKPRHRGRKRSGKTTLLRVLLGLTPPSEGRALFRERDITNLAGADRDRFCRDVAMILPGCARLSQSADVDPRSRGRAARSSQAVHARRTQRPGRGLARSRRPAAGGDEPVRDRALRRPAAARRDCPRARVQSVGAGRGRGRISLDVSTQAQLLQLLRANFSGDGTEPRLHHAGPGRGGVSVRARRGDVPRGGSWRPVRPKTVQQGAGPSLYARTDRRRAALLRPPVRSAAGEIPSPIDLPPGCRFAGRCTHVQDDCRAADPMLRPFAGKRSPVFHPVVDCTPTYPQAGADVRKMFYICVPLSFWSCYSRLTQRASASPPPRGILSEAAVARAELFCLSPALRTTGSSNPIAPGPPTGAIAFAGCGSLANGDRDWQGLRCSATGKTHVRGPPSPSQTESATIFAYAASKSQVSRISRRPLTRS